MDEEEEEEDADDDDDNDCGVDVDDDDNDCGVDAVVVDDVDDNVDVDAVVVVAVVVDDRGCSPCARNNAAASSLASACARNANNAERSSDVADSTADECASSTVTALCSVRTLGSRSTLCNAAPNDTTLRISNINLDRQRSSHPIQIK